MTLQVVQTARSDEFLRIADAAVSRDLGLRTASHGMFSARRVRTAGSWSVNDIVSASAWLTFVYLVEGWMTLRLATGEAKRVRAHDAVAQVPLSPSTVVEASRCLEFIEIQALDDPRVRELIPARPPEGVALDAPELHVKGQGPRDFFDYRNLGVADITNRQLEVEVIRAQRARKGGTGWHSHSMAQLSYGLSGWASLGVEGVAAPVIQEPGDALSIPADCVHNADSFSNDYWALQLQIPSDYSTTARSAPGAFAET
jgi:quercetin dioxygenase-like cupin family protein